MSNYWSADNSVRIGETKISVPSENGLSYSPGQKVQIFVDPSTKYMDGKETYLEFNVQLSLPSGKAPTRLQLDKCSSTLIKNLRIYDGSRGQMLEEISDYSSYVAVKYDYDKDINVEGVRALREGCACHTPENRGTEGTSKTGMANTITSPYFKKTTGNQSTTYADSDFLNAKVCIPLHTGIFANSETIFPVSMTNGLYIEIDLSEADDVVKQLDSVIRDVRTPLNPHFHSLNGREDPNQNTWPAGTATTKFFVDYENNLKGSESVSRFPFVVGEKIMFCKADNNGSGTAFHGDVPLTISAINLSTAANASAGLIEITTQNASVKAGAKTITGDYVLYSVSAADETSYDVSYKVSNVNLVVSQVQLDPGYEKGMLQKVREGKAIEFDIPSLTNYKHSILASDRQVSFQIFAQNSRAKSLLVIPQDSSVYTSAQKVSGSGTYVIKGTNYSNSSGTTKNPEDTCLASTRSAYTGICDGLSGIQFVINGKRVPSREISTKKIATKKAIDAYHLYEIEKVLDNSMIQPKSFSEFQNNFIFGRGFSAGGQNGVMDLRGKDLAVNLKYLAPDAPEKPKLFQSFVFHLRRLVLKENSVQVIM
mgnify:CR=1 FL=1|tara:strand:+ start:71 stop:1855 length:1785 start_codon:yes stop_codon:yes gene_type:complete